MHHVSNFTKGLRSLVERGGPAGMTKASSAETKHARKDIDDGGLGRMPARTSDPYPASNASTDLDVVDKRHLRDIINARKIQNAKLPIMRLPAEVFELAFLYLQKSSSSSWYPRGDCREGLQLCLSGTRWTFVLHVCSHWRTIGLNCSSLWTAIAVDSRYDNRSFIQESLLRSNGQLLRIALGDNDNDAREDVLAQFSRIQELSLFNTPVGAVKFRTPADILPSLDTLTIYEDDWLKSEVQSNTLPQLLSRMPALKYLHISRCHSDYGLLQALKPITGLRQLEICKLVFLSRSMLQAFLDVLDNNQGLEDLSLCRILFYGNMLSWFNPESRCVDMKALRRLWIARMNVQQIASLFACLRIHGQIELAVSIQQVIWERYQTSWNCPKILTSIMDMFPSTPSGTFVGAMLRVKTLRLTTAEHIVDITGVGDAFAWKIEECDYPNVVRHLVDLGIARVVEELWFEPAPLLGQPPGERRKPTTRDPLAVFTPFVLEALNIRKLLINLRTNERTGHRWLAEVFLSSSLTACPRLKVIEIDWFHEDLMNTLTKFVSDRKAARTYIPLLRLFMGEGYESDSPAWRCFLRCDAVQQLLLHVECTIFPFDADVRRQHRSTIRYPPVCVSRCCEGGRWDWPAWD